MNDANNNKPSSELQQKAIKFLETKWQENKRKCEVCGHEHWVIQHHLVTPIILENNSLQLGGISYPQIMAICSNCTNTKYFNATLMGLMSKEDGGLQDGNKK